MGYLRETRERRGERGREREREKEKKRERKMDLNRNSIVITVGITFFLDLGHKSDRFKKTVVMLMCH